MVMQYTSLAINSLVSARIKLTSIGHGSTKHRIALSAIPVFQCFIPTTSYNSYEYHYWLKKNTERK